ncbi:MAG: hypothetical protein AB7S69_03035 [Salinivirgaceae bacterium]|jgi:hypothetical protein
MKNYRIITIVLAMMFSCSNNDELDNQSATVIDSIFEFLVVNSANENLFDTATVNHLDINDLKLYHVKNGEPILYYNGNLSAPNGCFIKNSDNEIVVCVSLNSDPDEEKPVTLVRWNDSRTDTLEATYNRTNGHQKQEVWLNGDKVWDISMIDEYYHQKLVFN